MKSRVDSLSPRSPLSALLSAAAVAAVTAAALTAPAGPALAEPEPAPGGAPVRDFGNGAERNTYEAPAELPVQQTGSAAEAATRRAEAEAGYPRQTELPVYPDNPDDRAIRLGLTPYHEIAPRLNELQQRSDRISVEVVGESHQGRDLYLVTLTAPETPEQTAEQERMRASIEERPAAAARDRRIPNRYKMPVFVNNNIHGNEWEGTDAALRTIEELATSDDPEVAELLSRTRVYFNITNNPDGRSGGTRANGVGFDLNRDFITASQPETRAVRELLIDTQPTMLIDQHGYVNGTLIEPATIPHGQNYEYDLYIKHTYANALGMEQAILDLGYTPEGDGVSAPQIPFRDWEEGWDDWPPIFTPMYAPYQGAVAAATIEFPMRVNNADYTGLPVEELRRRSAINTDISAATMDATLDYALDNRGELIADQIEVFRRGEAGEPQVVPEDGWVPGYGRDDVYTTEFPRAYVIPAGEGQRSATAAARLVDHLIANDVAVLRATGDFRLGGTRYPAGSYLVDMHQAKRGLANVMLEAGRDISADVDAMYDISGWSHGLLWGATVDAVDSGDPGRVRAEPVAAAAPTGSVAQAGDLELRLDDGGEVAALNELLGQGVAVSWTGEGSVVVPAAARAAAEEAADRYGVRFAAAENAGARPLQAVTVAAAASADELFTLREMGFEVVPASTTILNGGFDWSGIDTLYVSSGLDYNRLNAQARAALDAYLERGGTVTRGSTGAAFNAAAGLLEVTAQAGRADANGVVRVSEGDGQVLSGFGDHAFVYSPLWFTGLGEGVAVEQSYATGEPMAAGHWRADDEGEGGPDSAAGQASVVSGTTQRGGAAVLFGTEPLFRNHPKGLFAQVARSLYWTAAPGAPAA
ncbi:M14 family zinc carboxypeptidase [Allonocardiopsis opalescens]|uniref:Zinc carboxypeptidase n=1 Tax=Allonocardiopsis opalescens TaxID=1144618 RepID=A0A2T0Q9F3_9ACTN|nr:M14 family zinc carboxypeptidase [Allonocardiopsis opalescens]PRY00475.1 zinc carboxypeptidase [Allonocardiopsis opalescens]